MPFVSDLLRYTNTYFVETGTWKGETTKLVADSGLFKTIYTIEFCEDIYNAAKESLKEYKNIHCFHGTSRTDLEFLIKDIHEPITFWLDAHWGGGVPSIDDDIKCPILHELEQIRKHPIKNHTIMIDDMRLMNGQHFSITIPQVLSKLKEINPNYTFKGYTDSECAGDVLVAFVEEKPALCIQKYLQKLSVPVLPPGIGDILRGCIAMIQFAKKYKYRFCVDRSSHPFWSFFEPSEYFIDNKINTDVKMYVTGDHMPRGFDQVEEELEHSFQSGQSFSCITNSFYCKENGKHVLGNISDDVATIMKKILSPNEKLKSIILNYYKSLGIVPSDNYAVIHLRFGDVCIEHPEATNTQIIEYLVNKIPTIQAQAPGVKFILFTDSAAIGTLLKEKIPSLFYTNTKRIHLGVLSSSLEGLDTTIAEMMIISNAKVILSNSRSGFSNLPAVIYNIPYHPVF